MRPAETSRAAAEATSAPAPMPAASRGRGAAAWLLGVAVFVTVAGMTAATFRGDGTAINAFLFLTAGLSHELAAQVERVAMSLALLLALAALFRPHWALLLPVCGYILAEAVARRHEQGYTFSEWALFAQAPRYLTPLGLILLVAAAWRAGPGGRWRRLGGALVIRVGLAVVFAVHGLEALRAHPGFVDYIIATAANLSGTRITERGATLTLAVIGAIDWLVAAALLLRPHPVVLGWAAFWGTVTAFSRMTAYGWGAYPEVLVRASHVLGPIALWFLANQAAKENKTPPSPPMDPVAPERPFRIETRTGSLQNLP